MTPSISMHYTNQNLHYSNLELQYAQKYISFENKKHLHKILHRC